MAMAMPVTSRLYVGNIPWSTTVDELRGLFTQCGNISMIDIPTGRQGRSRGYGIVEFSTPQEAAMAIQTLEGHTMGDRQINVREDKPPQKGAPIKPPTNRSTLSDTPATEGCRCYVGNLAWETTEESLVAHCSQLGGNVVNAEVARQPSGRSKGWGLVDFQGPDDAAAAITSLHNSELQGRSIIVRLERAGGAGAGNKPVGGGGGGGMGGMNGRQEASSGLQIVVRNLPWSTTSEDLRQVFQQVGNVIKAEAVCHADTGRSKGWGTVLFETREQAQAAIQGFNGVELENRPMQIKLDRFD